MGPGIIRLPRPGTGAGRRSRAAVCALFAAIGVAAGSPAQANERATARMGATVLTPISIIDANDMDFGRIALRGNPGVVVLTAAASAQCTTTGGLVHTGNCRAATFEGTAQFFTTLRAKRPNGNSITLSGPAGATMQVNNFTFGAGPGVFDMGQNGANHRFFVWNFSGDYTFYVGGTLNVAANQTPGVYNGTFEIQIAYN